MCAKLILAAFVLCSLEAVFSTVRERFVRLPKLILHRLGTLIIIAVCVLRGGLLHGRLTNCLPSQANPSLPR